MPRSTNKKQKAAQEEAVKELDRELDDLRAPPAKKSKAIFEDDKSTDFSKIEKK
jgi:hypothetical protein